MNKVTFTSNIKYRFTNELSFEDNFKLAIKIFDKDLKQMISGKVGERDLNWELDRIQMNLQLDVHSIIAMFGEIEVTKRVDKALLNRLGTAVYAEFLHSFLDCDYKDGKKYFSSNGDTDVFYCYFVKME